MFRDPWCPECQQVTAGCVRHSSGVVIIGPANAEGVRPIPTVPGVTFTLMGWKCPGCGACYSPYTNCCYNCGPYKILYDLGSEQAAPIAGNPFNSPAEKP